jgi:hypothetical protein
MLWLSQQFMPLFCGRQPHIRSLFFAPFWGVFKQMASAFA